MRIALIGMPTSGKSTIANILHESLGIPILDIDFLLEKKINYSLQEFINKNGDKEFLEKENELLLEINYPEKCIISTGGSVIYAKEAMDYMKSIGVKFIYLHASLEVLEERLSSQRDMRGIVMNNCNSWKELLIDRDKLYHFYANDIVETNNKTPNQIVKEILTKY